MPIRLIEVKEVIFDPKVGNGVACSKYYSRRILDVAKWLYDPHHLVFLGEEGGSESPFRIGDKVTQYSRVN
jgi:hypothetical protein